MGTLGAVLRIVAQRSMGNRRLLGFVVVGVVFASALAAAVAIYSDAVRDLGLSHALHTQPPIKLDIDISSSSQTARQREYGSRRDLTSRLLATYARPILRDTIRTGQSATFFLTPPGAPVPADENRPRANFRFDERASSHLHLVDGRPPLAAAPADPTRAPRIEALIAKSTADRLGVHVGDTFDLHPFWKPEAAPVPVVVSGIIEANDPNEEYWQNRPERLDLSTTTWPTYLFFIDENTFVNTLAGYLPDMDASYHTYGFVDISRINARNAATVQANLQGMIDAFRQNIAHTEVTTTLPDTIAGFRERLFFTRLPLFALMLQIVGIVLYYLVMVSTMLVERQTGEIALLKSRGASTTQVMTVYAIEGGALVLAGILLGPLLAAGVIALLGPTPPFRALSGGDLLAVHLSGPAFGLAFVGAVFALAALLWPAYRAARRSIVQYKQGIGRPPRQPAFLRYYLDLFLIVVGAFLFYELRQRGSLVTERLFGHLSTDPLLLISPALFMLMIALLFLRLFPLALRVGAWLARGTNGASIPLGLARMVRSPVHYSRLILLLILAAAVGVFAAGFRATLDRSYDDRVAYQAGAALRVGTIRQPSALSPDQLVAAVSSAAGGAAGTPVWRVDGSYTLGPYQTAGLTVLGVRPSDFPRAAFWRHDFSGSSLTSLLRPLSAGDAPTTQGPVLPAGSRRFGVWVWSSLPFNAVQYGARVEDAAGVAWDYRLVGPPADAYQPGQWQFYQADLSRPGLGRAADSSGPDPAATVRVQALFIRLGGGPATPERDSVWFDDLAASASADAPAAWWSAGFAAPIEVESFESLDGYEVMNGQSARPVPAAISRSETHAHGGQAAALLSFDRRRGGQTLYGLRVRDNGAPLPILASDTFLAAAHKKVGDDVQLYVNRQYLDARIAGRFTFFPTYTPDPTGSHLIVADLDRLLRDANRLAGGPDPGYVNEVWLGDCGVRISACGLGTTVTSETLKAKGIVAADVTDLSVLQASQQRDPLIAASWQGILFVSFGAVLLLTALGFGVYSYLSAQSRALEFAILRTMGFSGGQIVALVTFEQAFVILAGTIAGTLLGLPLGRLMIGYMGVTETGAKVLPPLISQVSWSTIAIADGALALIFVATIAALVLLYSRLAVHRALRMGEL